MPSVAHLLTLSGDLLRNDPVEATDGGYPDRVRRKNRCVSGRISQPSGTRANIGWEQSSDQDSSIYFPSTADVREGDLWRVTGGRPAYFVGTEWELHNIVRPSVESYTRANGRRIQTQQGGIDGQC